MNTAKSIEFKFNMDLQKKLKETIANVICGKYFLEFFG